MNNEQILILARKIQVAINPTPATTQQVADSYNQVGVIRRMITEHLDKNIKTKSYAHQKDKESTKRG